MEDYRNECDPNCDNGELDWTPPKKKSIVEVNVNPAYEIAIEQGQTPIYDLPSEYIYTLKMTGRELEAVAGIIIFRLNLMYENGNIVVEPERVTSTVAGLTQFLHGIRDQLEKVGHGRRFSAVLYRIEERWKRLEVTHRLAIDEGLSEEEIANRIKEIYADELEAPKYVAPITPNTTPL